MVTEHERPDDEALVLLPAEFLRDVLRRAVPPPEVVAEEDGWSVLLHGHPVAADGGTLDQALADLLSALRDYTDAWEEGLHAAPNHRHAAALVQLVALEDDDALLAWARGDERAQHDDPRRGRRMSRPTSVPMPHDVRERLERVAGRTGERPASLATRLIDEGLRMAEHPGIVFVDAGAGGRIATLARGPRVAAVVEVLTGLEASGEERIAQAAEWLSIHPSEVRTALGYYASFTEELDEELRLRLEKAAEERERHDAEQALPG